MFHVIDACLTARHLSIALLLTAVFGPFSLTARAQVGEATQGWPQFLGPDRNGTAAAPGVDFASWKTSAPEVAWRAETGPGYGGAAIMGDDVMILERVGGKDRLRVLDFSNGEERWSLDYEAPGRLQYAGSRTVPIVVEDRIYTGGGFGHVSCFSR
ncbi:MAG: hypothetical protein AB8H79_26695, partial [Myxococcota bacterium]